MVLPALLLRFRPASVVLDWCGRSVGGLVPGLTSESAGAAMTVVTIGGARCSWRVTA